MSKKLLARRIKNHLQITQRAADELTTYFVENVASIATQTGHLHLPDLGTFEVVAHKSYTTTNPRTGAPMTVPTRKTLRFRAAKAVRDALAS